MLILVEAAKLAQELSGIECEVIDLRTLLPWDRETCIASVMKTGRELTMLQHLSTGFLDLFLNRIFKNPSVQALTFIY